MIRKYSRHYLRDPVTGRRKCFDFLNKKVLGKHDLELYILSMLEDGSYV
jgi:hypothetical protein